VFELRAQPGVFDGPVRHRSRVVRNVLSPQEIERGDFAIRFSTAIAGRRFFIWAGAERGFIHRIFTMEEEYRD
jgi:hypothetical protein